MLAIVLLCKRPRQFNSANRLLACALGVYCARLEAAGANGAFSEPQGI